MVRPALRVYDQAAFGAAADQLIPSPGVTFRVLQPVPQPQSRAELAMEVAPLVYRVWAVCCFTGRWPLQVVGEDDMP